MPNCRHPDVSATITSDGAPASGLYDRVQNQLQRSAIFRDGTGRIRWRSGERQEI
jgi:hypothetical protein